MLPRDKVFAHALVRTTKPGPDRRDINAPLGRTLKTLDAPVSRAFGGAIRLELILLSNVLLLVA